MLIKKEKSRIKNTWASGVIGSRSSLRNWSRKGWGFESPLAHA